LAEHDETLARVIDTLKEPVEIDPSLDKRVMAAIARDPVTRTPAGWRTRRWTIRVSPVGALAAAAVVAAVALGSTQLLKPRTAGAPVQANASQHSAEVTQFVLVAPTAHTVALVGDFNDWSLSATQLARKAGDGVWWVTVALPPGRYRYAFVVDGITWSRDPNAPPADDEFGRPNSVVTVGGV
jgi:anti-sigma-K factor RskA